MLKYIGIHSIFSSKVFPDQQMTKDSPASKGPSLEVTFSR